ncbi:MAG TPA: molybdopterin-dependent oxidoreductase, partial [Nitrospirota bacterium]
MTVMTGQTYRRTRFKKRTHRNQDLGPFINHEMNRCIQCYRCVRFYRGIAGGRDLNVFAAHDNVYFGRHEDGVLESEFSGNLVEICPTGVFTDKTFKRHYTRKWDLQTAPSICVHCGIGCNTLAGERYGSLRRILNRYHHEVNGYFLCDRGRFGYEFVNSEKRIRTPFALISGEQKPDNKEGILKRIAEIMSSSKSIIGIGSPRASLESNFALRSLVGPDNFYSGMSAEEHALVSLIISIAGKGAASTPSLKDVQSADAVLVLGEDVTNTAPMLALALRQASRSRQAGIAAKIKIPAWDDASVRNAAQDELTPVFIVTSAPTRLDDIALKTHRASPDAIARLGFAIAHELNGDSPAPSEISQEDLALAKEIALVLRNAERPLIVSGVGCMSEPIIQATANVAWALNAAGREAQLSYTVLECNSLGIGLMGAHSIERLHNRKIDVMIILENDLFRRSDQAAINDLLGNANHVIVIDHLTNATTEQAGIVLPAATFAESTGTLVNNEGRAQRFYQVFQPGEEIQAGWKWINDIMKTIGRKTSQQRDTFDAVSTEMISAIPLLSPVRDIAPLSDFRIQGMKVPRQPHRYSGRTAILAQKSVHEPKPPEDADSALAYSMEGYEGHPPASLISRYWSPGWNSVQSLNKFQQEIGGPLHGEAPGKRLLEPDRNTSPSYFPAPEKKDKPSAPPVYDIFGSEELSN